MKGIIKDAAILCIITLVSGLLLGFVYDATKDQIAQLALETEINANRAVMPAQPEGENLTFVATFMATNKNELISYGNGDISDIKTCYQSSNPDVPYGYVVYVTSHEGYGGDIKFQVGILSDGTITGVEITEIGETAGLGMKAKEPGFRQQFIGKNAEVIKYTKNGASNPDEIDAISSATITTNAITNGVNGALSAFRSVSMNGGAVNE